MYIEVLKKGKSYWWRLKSRNHRIFASSETYANRRNLIRAAVKVASSLGLEIVDRTKGGKTSNS